MDEVKSMLANEGLKHFINKEAKNHIKFLDDKLNNIQLSNDRKLDALNDDVRSLKASLSKVSNELSLVKEENFRLNSELCLQKEKALKFIDKDFVKKEIKSLRDDHDMVLSRIRDKIARFSEKISSNKESIERILYEISEYGPSLEMLKEIVHKNKCEISSLDKMMKDFSDKEHSLRSDFFKESSALLDRFKLRVQEQDKAVEKAEKLALKSDKRLKQNAVELSNEFREKFNSFIRDFEERFDQMSVYRKEIVDRLYDLEQKNILALKSEKSDKNIEDFIKQVGYNAKQIAKLQESLEGKR